MAMLFLLIVVAFFVSSGDATCTCGTCWGPNNAYCLKNDVQCQSGTNDNPLINDVDRVLEAYKKVIKPDSHQSTGIYVQPNSHTVFVVEDWVYGFIYESLCAWVCEELDDYVAAEFWVDKIHANPKIMCSFAYGCDSYPLWHSKAHHWHGILLDTGHHAQMKSLPADQGQDYVPYSKAKAHSDIEDVALTFDHYFYFAVAVVAFLFFGIGICLGFAIKKYPKQVQHP